MTSEDGSKTPLPNIEYQQSNYVAHPPNSDPNQPWWIPTNEDTNDAYNKWYETAYMSALDQSSKDGSEKKTLKSFKRKHEEVDFKVDAERIADAQKQLSELMKPLKCDLCNAVMNTTIQANNHYKGKPHQKKVSMFLNESAKKVKIEDDPVSSSNSDVNSYCGVCKIWFTSLTDATQHYAGKKHNKAAFGIVQKKPSHGSQMVHQIPYDPRFGIGCGFQENLQTPQPLPPSQPLQPTQPQFTFQTPNLIPPVASQYLQPSLDQKISLKCDVCGIKVNRIDQLEFHFKGKNHLKQLKLRGLISVATPNVSVPVPKTIDFSSYRTPSGLYYCAPCNLSVATEILFAQHVEGKKHKTQIHPKQHVKKSPSDSSKQ